MRSVVAMETASRSNIRVRDERAGDAADHLGRDERGGGAGGDEPEGSFDEGDDGVERRRDRLERQDERHEDGTGDQAVLQQLEPHVVRGEPAGGDAGPDHGGDQEPGPDELGDRASSQCTARRRCQRLLTRRLRR